MRLIDADALMAYVTELYEYDLCHADADDYTEGRASAEHYIIEKIREMPAIDAIPVEWLRQKMQKPLMTSANPFDYVLCEWQDEQEAR